MYKLAGFSKSVDKESNKVIGYLLYLTRPISDSFGEGECFLVRPGKKSSLWLPKDVFESKGFFVGCHVEFACDFNGRLIYNSILVS